MSETDPIVEEHMERFKYAYTKAWEHFERMERIQKQYENKINTVKWPSAARISLPLTFIAVEEQLGPAVEYLVPKGRRFVHLMPVNTPMPAQTIKDIEDDLRYTLVYEMNLKRSIVPAIRDCYKFGVGYMLVDTTWVTPPSTQTLSVFSGGRQQASVRNIAPGEARRVPTATYVPPCCVIPMPDGSETDGPQAPTAHYVVQFMGEFDFINYFTKNQLGSEEEAQEIVDEARGQKWDARLPSHELVYRLAGKRLSTSGDERIPVSVPIIRGYTANEHIMIVNGTKKLWHEKDKYETMKSDLVKFSAWPDGDKWFPMGITEASEKLALGASIWYSGLVDLARYHLNPTRVINAQMIQNPNDVPRGPKADIVSNGDARAAVGHLELPQMSQGLFTVGEFLTRMHSHAMAEPNFGAQGSPGLVRGGANALEMLMQQSTSRQYLAALMLKAGGMKDLVEKVFIKKQILTGVGGNRFVREGQNSATGDRTYEEVRVTQADLRNIFRVMLDLPSARINTAGSFQERLNVFDRAAKYDDLFEVEGLFEFLTDDYDELSRALRPADVRRQRQEQRAQANLQGMARGQSGPPPIPQGQQALAGAALGG